MKARFGCDRCSAEAAARAWSYCRDKLRVDRALVDDSRFIVQLRHCPTCGQRFLWVLTEIVDWDGGDGAEYRQIIPVTAFEADSLARKAQFDQTVLPGLCADRRFLQVDRPTGEPRQRSSWSLPRALA